jgi:hypothetical protein
MLICIVTQNLMQTAQRPIRVVNSIGLKLFLWVHLNHHKAHGTLSFQVIKREDIYNMGSLKMLGSPRRQVYIYIYITSLYGFDTLLTLTRRRNVKSRNISAFEEQIPNLCQLPFTRIE